MKALRLYQPQGSSLLREVLAPEALASGRVVWVDSPQDADLVISVPKPVGGAETEPAPTVLTPREREILEYLADGWANDEIADRLGITAHTVKFHLDGLYRKLGVGRRTEAVREGYKLGFLRL